MTLNPVIAKSTKQCRWNSNLQLRLMRNTLHWKKSRFLFGSKYAPSLPTYAWVFSSRFIRYLMKNEQKWHQTCLYYNFFAISLSLSSSGSISVHSNSSSRLKSVNFEALEFHTLRVDSWVVFQHLKRGNVQKTCGHCPKSEYVPQQTVFTAHSPILCYCYIKMAILKIRLRCWVLFLMQDVVLRAYADKNWLNIMALSAAITGREVIGFTNQPWLWVYSGTGLYGSYFRVWWAICQSRGLVLVRTGLEI